MQKFKLLMVQMKIISDLTALTLGTPRSCLERSVRGDSGGQIHTPGASHKQSTTDLHQCLEAKEWNSQ